MFTLVFGVVIAIVAVLAFAATKQPDTFRVARWAKINSDVSVLFDYVNDLSKWHSWSPWARLDPNSKTTFEGPKAGVGAIMHWEGNRKVGAGSMTILESQPNSTIKFKLVFLRPMQATHFAEFAFKVNGAKTEITWSMTGENSYGGKVMGLFLNCDKMIGRNFENGFANLRALVEKSSP